MGMLVAHDARTTTPANGNHSRRTGYPRPPHHARRCPGSPTPRHQARSNRTTPHWGGKRREAWPRPGTTAFLGRALPTFLWARPTDCTSSHPRVEIRGIGHKNVGVSRRMWRQHAPVTQMRVTQGFTLHNLGGGGTGHAEQAGASRDAPAHRSGLEFPGRWNVGSSSPRT